MMKVPAYHVTILLVALLTILALEGALLVVSARSTEAKLSALNLSEAHQASVLDKLTSIDNRLRSIDNGLGALKVDAYITGGEVDVTGQVDVGRVRETITVEVDGDVDVRNGGVGGLTPLDVRIVK